MAIPRQALWTRPRTPVGERLVNGGNPTKAFLSGSVGSVGPFSGSYQNIAGEGWVNWLFMLGLIGIAVGLLLGTVMRLACAGGSLLVVLMWSASLPPSDDVFMDNHITYALLLAGLALVGAGNTLGIGQWWTQTSLVQRYPWLTRDQRRPASRDPEPGALLAVVRRYSAVSNEPSESAPPSELGRCRHRRPLSTLDGVHDQFVRPSLRSDAPPRAGRQGCLEVLGAARAHEPQRLSNVLGDAVPDRV